MKVFSGLDKLQPLLPPIVNASYDAKWLVKTEVLVWLPGAGLADLYINSQKLMKGLGIYGKFCIQRRGKVKSNLLEFYS